MVAPLAWAYLGTALVLVVPGVLVASLLRMRLRMLATWAAVPVFSLGAVFVLAELTNLTGAPFGVAGFVVLVGMLAGGMLVLRRHGGARGVVDDGLTAEPEEPGAESDGGLARRVAYGLLALGIAVGVLTWARGMNGHDLVPPGEDALRHGFFVARIIDTQSVDMSRVLVSDPKGLNKVASYYPLGMHASAAIATRLVGAEIGRVLLAFTVVFAAVVFPLGMFVLARFLAPRWPLIAGFTAVVVPTLVLYPYEPIQFGGLSLIVGMAIVPVSVVLITRAVTANGPPLKLFSRVLFDVVPAALVLLTAISVHSSQLPVILLLVALLVVERAWRDRAPEMLLRALVRGLTAMLLMVLLFAPTVTQSLNGVSERTSIDVTKPTSLHAAIAPILTLRGYAFLYFPHRQGLLAVLALLGAGIWLLRRRPAWVLGYASVVAVTLLAAVSKSAFSRALTLPWYREPQRVDFNQAFFVPFFAAIVLAFAVGGVARLLRSRWWMLPATAGALTVFVTFSGLQADRLTRSLLGFSFENDARVTPASQAAFAWLREHARRDDTVVNDGADGALWMYAQQRLNPLLGVVPADVELGRTRGPRDWRDRSYLLHHVHLLGADARADQLTRRYHARWIYFDEKTFFVHRHVLNLDALRHNSHLNEVFHRNTVHVLAINDL